MATSISILGFHSLDDRQSAISFSPLLFRQAMERLHKSGYRTLGLEEVIGYLRRQEPFPDSAFVITFDDGYQSVYQEAFPVLQEFGFTATIFITVGEESSDRLPGMEGRTMLSWQEVEEMHRLGITIGSHTLTHPDLTSVSLNRIETELQRSKRMIEDRLSVPVTCFAYPYGYYDRPGREIVRRHYDCACSSQLGRVKMSSDLYALERVETYYLRTHRLFELMLSPLFPFYLQARRLPRAIRQAFFGHRRFT
jgi:peptidoglycan/xylan/chitin deacetylase (PgdA/CDA1 family)